MMKKMVQIDQKENDPKANALVDAKVRELRNLTYDKLLECNANVKETVIVNGAQMVLQAHRVVMADNRIRIVVSLSSSKNKGPLELSQTACQGFIVSKDNS